MNGHVRKARIERFVQLADILALSPRMENGSLKLTVVVTEAKYVDASSLTAKKKESQKQLRETHNRINEAVLGDPLRVEPPGQASFVQPHAKQHALSACAEVPKHFTSVASSCRDPPSVRLQSVDLRNWLDEAA
jgi:hypothetical protein